MDVFPASSETFLSLRGTYEDIDEIFLDFPRFFLLHLGTRWWCGKTWEDFQVVVFNVGGSSNFQSCPLLTPYLHLYLCLWTFYSSSWGMLFLGVSRSLSKGLYFESGDLTEKIWNTSDSGMAIMGSLGWDISPLMGKKWNPLVSTRGISGVRPLAPPNSSIPIQPLPCL